MVINLFNYFLIIVQSHRLEDAAAGRASSGAIVSLMYFLRFALYIGGLVLVGWLHQLGFDYFNIVTTVVAYLVTSGVVFLTGARNPHKKVAPK